MKEELEEIIEYTKSDVMKSGFDRRYIRTSAEGS